MIDKQLAKKSLGWGFILWLIGYILGIVLFFAVPVSLIGWFILPIGVVITVWVLFKRVESTDFRHYLVLAVVWTLIAVAFDYLFVVKVLQPADGYYKLDVYVYYALTFALPLIAYWRKKSNA
ncbi:MAG TPA: hypothetical protein VN328_00455 [Thermodesulfovibrionales bacterium]|nr:hypothetical protein [Thermodesulfovibrionales bacterium]